MRISDWSSDVCSSDLLDARDVRHTNLPPVGIAADDDVGKILGVGQAALRFDAQLEAAAIGMRRLPERTRSDLHILAPQRGDDLARGQVERSEEHTSELQSLMRISYAVFCLKTKTKIQQKSKHI